MYVYKIKSSALKKPTPLNFENIHTFEASDKTTAALGLFFWIASIRQSRLFVCMDRLTFLGELCLLSTRSKK